MHALMFYMRVATLAALKHLCSTWVCGGCVCKVIISAEVKQEESVGLVCIPCCELVSAFPLGSSFSLKGCETHMQQGQKSSGFRAKKISAANVLLSVTICGSRMCPRSWSQTHHANMNGFYCTGLQLRRNSSQVMWINKMRTPFTYLFSEDQISSLVKHRKSDY